MVYDELEDVVGQCVEEEKEEKMNNKKKRKLKEWKEDQNESRDSFIHSFIHGFCPLIFNSPQLPDIKSVTAVAVRAVINATLTQWRR